MSSSFPAHLSALILDFQIVANFNRYKMLPHCFNLLLPDDSEMMFSYIYWLFRFPSLWILCSYHLPIILLGCCWLCQVNMLHIYIFPQSATFFSLAYGFWEQPTLLNLVTFLFFREFAIILTSLIDLRFFIYCPLYLGVHYLCNELSSAPLFSFLGTFVWMFGKVHLWNHLGLVIFGI